MTAANKALPYLTQPAKAPMTKAETEISRRFSLLWRSRLTPTSFILSRISNEFLERQKKPKSRNEGAVTSFERRGRRRISASCRGRAGGTCCPDIPVATLPSDRRVGPGIGNSGHVAVNKRRGKQKESEIHALTLAKFAAQPSRRLVA